MPAKQTVLLGETKANPEIAEAIAEFRKAHRRSQFRLALELQVTPNAVAQWESGRRTPDDWNIFELYQLASRWGDRTFETYFRGKMKRRKPDGLPERAPEVEVIGTRTITTNARPAPRNKEKDELLRHYDEAATGLKLIYESAAAGRPDAQNDLKDFAERLRSRANIFIDNDKTADRISGTSEQKAKGIFHEPDDLKFPKPRRKR